MKKKEKAYSIALTSVFIIFLVFASSTASASDDNVLSDEFSKEGSNIAAYTVDETRITTSGSASNPDIYSNKIVYNKNADIFLYNLSTQNETQITTNTSQPYPVISRSYPVIYGNNMVSIATEYYEDEWDSYNIYSLDAYDLFTKKITGIGGSYQYSEINLGISYDIYNNRVVWYINEMMGGTSIYMYDLDTQKNTLIMSGSYDNPRYAENPHIYGNRIVWLDTDNYNICMYNLSIKNETQISTSGSASNPDIYGDRIVWQDSRNGNSDIYMYNLSTKKETQITSSPDYQTSPKIYGNRILWKDVGGEDDGWEYHGIYMCDLSTNQKMKITSGGDGSEYDIYDNRIVWTDNRNGGSDIYMGTLITSPPIAAFSASPTSGKAPLTVTFTDKSKNYPTSWKWTFGDGTNSTLQNPTHRYRAAGNYTVKLTATNALGSNTSTKTNYIKVIPTNTRPGPYSSK